MPRGRPIIPVPDRRDLEDAVKEGTQDAAASAFGCSVRTLRRWLRAEGIRKPRAEPRPARVRKLDSEVAKEMRSLYATDRYTQARLGEMFGVSQSMVARVVNNKAYPERALGFIGGSADVQVGYRHS